jgi:hypothetical protein
MNKALIIGALALVALAAFFAANLKAALKLKILSGAAAGISKPQKWLWRLTGSEEQFLLAVFLIDIAALIFGGLIYGAKPGSGVPWLAGLFFAGWLALAIVIFPKKE